MTKHEQAINRFNDLQKGIEYLWNNCSGMNLGQVQNEVEKYYDQCSILIKNYCTESDFFEKKFNSLRFINSNYTWNSRITALRQFIGIVLTDLEIQKEKFQDRVKDLEMENKLFMQAAESYQKEIETLKGSPIKKGIKSPKTFKRTALLLTFVLLTYLNLTIAEVFNINYPDSAKYVTQGGIVLVIAVALLENLSEKQKLLIELSIAILAIVISLALPK